MATSGFESGITQKNEEKDQDLICSICLRVYKKPKLLPCLHTFCLDCLDKHYQEQEDNNVPCPLCRRMFCMPSDGVEKLPDDPLKVKLIKIKDNQEKKCQCDPCREIEEIIKADSFCMECRQSLCQRCTKLHSKVKSSKHHKLVSIEEKPTDYELQRLMSGYCGKHDNKKLEVYCCDCKDLICALCHVEDHNKHECRTSHDVAKQMKEQAENDKKNIEKYLIVLSERRQILEKAKEACLQQVLQAESSLKRSLDSIRKLLDDCERDILQRLLVIKDNRMKELGKEKELEDHRYTTLESFHKYSGIINEYGTDRDIIKGADDLHRRAEELISDEMKREAKNYDEVEVRFNEPKTLTSEEMKKFIGEIVHTTSNENLVASDSSFSTSAEVKITEVRTAFMGVAVVDDQIFVVGEGQSKVYVYDSHSLTASRDINIPNMETPQGLAGCSHKKALYISDWELSCVHRVDLNNNNSVTCWETSENHYPRGISVTHEHNVLVVVWRRYDKTSLYGCDLYTSEGQLLLEVKFDRSITRAKQSIQLSTELFIVCHVLSSSRGMTMINNQGKIINYYHGEKGGDNNHTFKASSIAVDYKNILVFVADHENNRVLLIDTDLNYLGQIRVPRDFKEPYRLCYDSFTDRLLVAEGNQGRILIFSKSPSTM